MASVFDGLDDYLRELRELPGALTNESRDVVVDTADTAAAAIRAAYPERTGNLRAGVVVTREDAGPFGTAARVRSTSPHARIYENGSAGKKRLTSKGWNRGVMPPAHVFIPTVVRERKGMYRTLADLLERRGVPVTGLP